MSVPANIIGDVMGQTFDGQDMQMSARFAGDDRLFVQFYVRAVINNTKSAEAGRPIFEDKDYVRIIVPGDSTSIVDTEVTDQHRMRFASRWEAYKRNEHQKVEGTPLSMIPWFTPSAVMEFRAVGVQTAEQLVGMSDQNASKFQGFSMIRDKVQSYLDRASEGAEDTKLARVVEEKDAQIATLGQEIDELRQAIQDLRSSKKE